MTDTTKPIGPREVAAEHPGRATFGDVLRAYGLEGVNDFIPRYLNDSVMFPELDTPQKAEVHVWVHLRGVLDDLRQQDKRKAAMLESYDGDPASPSPLNPHRGKYTLAIVIDVTDTLRGDIQLELKSNKFRRYRCDIGNHPAQFFDISFDIIREHEPSGKLDDYIVEMAKRQIEGLKDYPDEMNGNQADRDNYDTIAR